MIELLIVVAIIGILAAVAVPNFFRAQERALMASGASNYHTIATALQSYLVDYNTLPLADRTAGPFVSNQGGPPRNGPAAGGSWDGLPWILYENHYLTSWKTLFCPRYLKLYSGGATRDGKHPRFHNFRYAYNSSALSSGGHAGGAGNVMNGQVWIVRDLYLGPKDGKGWFALDYPNYPGDFNYPWTGLERGQEREQVMYADMAVRVVIGGTDTEQ